MSGIAPIDKYRSVYLDSNIFIYYLEAHSRFGIKVKPIFDQLHSGKLKAATSYITLIEILSFPFSKKEVTMFKKLFLDIPRLEIINLDQEVALKTAEIRRSLRFPLGDSIQLASAVQAKAQAFITNDKRLKKFKEPKVLLLDEI